MSSQTVNTTVPSTTSGISYLPTDAWGPVQANGATNGQGEFLIGDALNGKADAFITYTFTQPATGFQYWGWQRSDGGLFSICFDCPPTYTLGDRVDALNTSTNGNEDPRLLYSKYDLSYAIHNLTIANLFDQRATIGNSTNGGYGQMSLDRFVLITPSTPPTTSTTPPSSTSGTGSPSASPSSAAAGGGGQSGGSSNVGAIAGGVVGGVGGLALIALLLWFLFFRKRNAQGAVQDMAAEQGLNTYEPKDETPLEGNPIAPFVLGTTAPQGGYANQGYWPPAASSSSGPSAAAASDYGGARPLPGAPAVAAVAAAAAPRPKGARNMSAAPVTRASDLPLSPSVYPATSDASGPTSGYATVTPRREEDAGFLQGDEVAETLPPDYDAATARRRAAGP
ncbi:hypothetical protein CALVIDRAFT_565922 [Calocera viscosa TUFC12733]|uniref:Mid2 domain-containing protein n=1 Tax=Calocera viscosa (strain TUFC12733) TaxID=1330018 RepID=A0A167K5D0_CALVF|nr:hypothetical protein CALVIDRAFT_565922 [Calocera viscosa TUFC12733]